MTMKSMLVKKVQMEGDPISFEEAMEAEMNSMNTNDVWDLEEIPDGAKIVGCKRVYNTKRDSKGNIERYKARLVAICFTQR